MGIQGDQTSDPRLSPLKTRSFWRKAGSAFLRLWGLWLVGLALLVVPPFYRAVKPPEPTPKEPATETPRADLRELQAALERGDDAAILDFFRRRRLSAEERTRVQGLIGKLGNDSFRVRMQAGEELTKIGPRTAGMLRQGTRHPDAETAEQARQLLVRVVTGTQANLFEKAFCRLQEASLPGTVSVLLDYLPDVENEQLAEEVRSIVAAISNPESRPDPTLTAALKAPLPETRWAAAVILAKLPAHRSSVLELLDDKDTEVRYQTAVALVWAVGVCKKPCQTLIDLLSELRAHKAWTVLDLLYQLAKAEGPAVGLGIGTAGRQRCRDGWQKWLAAQFDGTFKPPGFESFHMIGRLPATDKHPKTLLIDLDLRSNRGSIHLAASDGTLKRELDGLDYPVWVEQIGDESLLVVQYREGRVTERNWSGEIAWEVSVPHPVFARREANGSTFIATRDALWKADRTGKATIFRSWPERIVATARPCLNGDIVVLTVDGTCIFLDSEGKEKRRFETGCKLVHAPGIDVTANNRVLVPDHAGQRVVEFSPQGEVLWQAAVPSGLGTASPVCVQRLPDGNTLVTSTASREVIEISRLGRVAWRLPDVRSGASWRPIAATRR